MAKRIHHFAGIRTESTTHNVLAREPHPYDAVFADKPKNVEVSEIAKKLQQWRLYCCAVDVEVIDDTALVHTSLAGNKENKMLPKRGRKKRKKKKHVAYSREEIEALRFQNLDDQKKKWAAVYRRLRPTVAAEYDGLIDKHHRTTSLH